MLKTFRRVICRDWISILLGISYIVVALVSTSLDILNGIVLPLGAIVLSIIIFSQIAVRDDASEAKKSLDGLRDAVLANTIRNAVHEVPSGDIRGTLENMLDNSSEWYFRGGSARWQREAVLPALAANSARKIPYKAQIISPFDQKLCTEYAEYRKKSRPDDRGTDWKSIQIELLSFIYAASYWSSLSRVTPEIHLLHRYSPFRLDANSQSAVVTIADQKKNGLRANSGNWYYTSILDEFESEIRDSAALSIPVLTEGVTSVQSVINFLRDLAEQNGAVAKDWPADFSEIEMEMIYDLSNVSEQRN